MRYYILLGKETALWIDCGDLNLGPSQPEGVGHHAHRGEGHGPGGQHRVQVADVDGQPGDFMQHPGGHGHQGRVVEKGPEQVLLDGAHGGLGQLDGPAHAAQLLSLIHI